MIGGRGGGELFPWCFAFAVLVLGFLLLIHVFCFQDAFLDFEVTACGVKPSFIKVSKSAAGIKI